MNQLLLYVTISFLAILAFCAYLVISLPKKNLLKFVTIPLLIWLGFFLYISIPNLMGSPIIGFPKGEFELVGYVIKMDDGKKIIEAWVTVKDDSKLYSFPYTEGVENTLSEMSDANKMGLPQTGEFEEGDPTGGGVLAHGFQDPRIKTRENSPESLPPKG